MKRLAGICLGACIVVGAFAWQDARAQSSATRALTAEDYLDIQQLVASYAYALDSAADDGNMLAGLFAANGVLAFEGRSIDGRQALAAFARSRSPKAGPTYANTFNTNLIITPSSAGAAGKAYVARMDISEGGTPSTLDGGGHFYDVYVKSAEGWRIQKREYVPSTKANPPQASPAQAR